MATKNELNTVNVKQLKDLLEDLPDDMPVFASEESVNRFHTIIKRLSLKEVEFNAHIPSKDAIEPRDILPAKEYSVILTLQESLHE